MNTTIVDALKILNNAVDPQYSTEVAGKKMLTALTMAVIAVAEELEKANQLKAIELRRVRMGSK
jgi:hypothetical protein